MSENARRKIAPTVAEAQVGDLLWHRDPQRNRYDAAGKYEGRGVWTLTRVVVVGRQSIEVGSQTYSTKHDRKTGALRSRSGLSGLPYLRGYQERAAEWLEALRWPLAEKVRNCRDAEILKTVAFMLGVEQPDFTAAPSAIEADDAA